MNRHDREACQEVHFIRLAQIVQGLPLCLGALQAEGGMELSAAVNMQPVAANMTTNCSLSQMLSAHIGETRSQQVCDSIARVGPKLLEKVKVPIALRLEDLLKDMVYVCVGINRLSEHVIYFSEGALICPVALLAP
jgi:hypothetical protein